MIYIPFIKKVIGICVSTKNNKVHYLFVVYVVSRYISPSRFRPVVLFGDPAIQRAQETGEPRTSLERKADTFDEQGMVSLFASRPRKQPQETARSLPPDMRQLIVDLRVEMPNMSIREIAEICDTRFHRRPSHHSIKTVLASGPPPSIQMRRFPLWNATPDPAQRRHNIVQLHAEGWSVASIAEYLSVSKQTVYTTLKRWVQEGVKGLDDKSHARKAPRNHHRLRKHLRHDPSGVSHWADPTTARWHRLR